MIAIVVLLLVVVNWILNVEKMISTDNKTISLADYHRLIVSIVSAGITFIAVVIALFKDDLREMWHRPKIIFSEPSNITIEELSDQVSSDNIKAKKYISRIEVQNTGNVPAINAEIYLEKLEFKEKNSNIKNPIETTGTPLNWNGNLKETIIIPSGSRKLINIVEIQPPAIVSTPDSPKDKESSKMIIGKIPIKDQEKGIWTAMFGLYSQNHKPIRFVVEIEWNGVWKFRLTEMEKMYSCKIQN
ncbi:hypothetical protein [uncultured Acetobacteroides sp.]|uniref:hypothetical protein n=1 Tax=uncultured Acetobacteroides sp. TaxID=1760811 RepID=UPI0029F5580E|nr:hypothetical protein [uncultured Acetobacteroides sp.]